MEAAENILSSYLEQEEPSDGEDNTDEEKKGMPVWAIVLISVGGTLVVCAGAFVGFLMWKKYGASIKEKFASKTAVEEATEEVVEETAEEATEETTEDVQEPVEKTEE